MIQNHISIFVRMIIYTTPHHQHTKTIWTHEEGTSITGNQIYSLYSISSNCELCTLGERSPSLRTSNYYRFLKVKYIIE